ncbi:hypothetical protein [Hyphomonas sp.]|jgi:competence protein ComEC|uniref:hypothetical protein n=1 Tax=Hyphomonas sp. TaxID=87 RepID=UPI0037C09316
MAESRPATDEGWVQDFWPGRKPAGPLLGVHSVAGRAGRDWPEYVRLTHANWLEVAPGRLARCRSVPRLPPGPSMPGEQDFRRSAWNAQPGGVG